mmetsp:Transcript_14308/g.17793  ORF Transcript_14308/g.17793 Transcript_14308/m.17793 type:complete len:91 (-) Transcript_14308:554-826(-)
MTIQEAIFIDTTKNGIDLDELKKIESYLLLQKQQQQQQRKKKKNHTVLTNNNLNSLNAKVRLFMKKKEGDGAGRQSLVARADYEEEVRPR